MKVLIAALLTGTLLITMISGFTFWSPDNDESSKGVVIGESSKDQTPDHETPTVQAVSSRSPLIPERSELAPPYDEIRQHVEALVINRNKENDIKGDKDGIGNRELEAALTEYQLSLRGMKVQNWKGWIRKINPNELQTSEDSYIVSVYMDDPNLEAKPRARAHLYDVSREQLERLIAAQESEVNSVDWYSVEFTGTMVGVTVGAKVYIYDAAIEIDTQPSY
ncbi:MAG TPA: hypothetical protein VF952_17605 [Chloroflexia bacterium]